MPKHTWTKENAPRLLQQDLPPENMMAAYKAGWASGWIAATFTLRDMLASEGFTFDEARELVTTFWSIGPLNDYGNDVPVESETEFWPPKPKTERTQG